MPNTMLLQDFIDAPSKAEDILAGLSAEQLLRIEQAVHNVKKRKLDTPVTPPSPPSEPEDPTDTPSTKPLPIAQQAATNVVTTLLNNLHQSPSSSMAAAIATYLATAMSTAVANTLQQQQQLIKPASPPPPCIARPKLPSEAVATLKDGVEWVSFVYSHNRIMKKYTIRTDIDPIGLRDIEDKFKTDNCVYPRANLPRDQYKGNRWSYETECNVLGWRLAWLNKKEIGGKRGLIQRAVDCYRNLYPSMRSRRVARQAKLLNGTLRKRKYQDDEDADPLNQWVSSLTRCPSAASPIDATQKELHPADLSSNFTPYVTPTSLDTAIVKPANQPKTMAMEDLHTGTRCRVKINVASVSLDDIPLDFRLANAPYPRHARNQSLDIDKASSSRIIEETICNELAWKLAWLNPKVLVGHKLMLQRAVDLFRKKFMPSLQPRKTVVTPTNLALPTSPPELMMVDFDQPMAAASPTLSYLSGTTASLDFTDCLSLGDAATLQPEAFVSPMLYGGPSSSTPPSQHLSPINDWCSSASPRDSQFNCVMHDMLDAFTLPSAVLNNPDTSTDFSSPSLPSSTLEQQDLLVKMENIDGLSEVLLDSFF
ncbi:hypothetical protein DM01DRAFT_1331589 [Hesseltinella vesiculosa]|uniref:DUF8032 domain-containing protein n=1 Tax=Hesseltinella vesiculosa TaxID=101127 RepID=A0A1X2GWZ1_9FUNG|nr:hypothetical protein DM01DRAFT_1331589 [Hesseltinella vesiculosa]